MRKKSIIIFLISLLLISNKSFSKTILKFSVSDNENKVPLEDVLMLGSFEYVKFRSVKSFKKILFEGKTDRKGNYYTEIDNLLNNEGILKLQLSKDSYVQLKVKERVDEDIDTLKFYYNLSTMKNRSQKNIQEIEDKENRLMNYSSRKNSIMLLSGIQLGAGDKSTPYENSFMGIGIKLGLQYSRNITSNYNFSIEYEFNEIKKSELLGCDAKTKENTLKFFFDRRINDKFRLINVYIGTHIGISHSETKWEDEELSFYFPFGHPNPVESNPDTMKGTDTVTNFVTGINLSTDYYITKNLKMKLILLFDYNIPVDTEREFDYYSDSVEDNNFDYQSGVNTDISLSFGYYF